MKNWRKKGEFSIPTFHNSLVETPVRANGASEDYWG